MTSEKVASLEFETGTYNGTTNTQGIPHGQGRLEFKENDSMDRRYYEGQWVGAISGLVTPTSTIITERLIGAVTLKMPKFPTVEAFDIP